MEQTTETILEIAESLSSEVTAILPPLQVLRDCEAIRKTNADVRELTIGHTESGHALKAYEFGQGQNHVLFYGFPDPGEAVGGTTILCLLRGLTESKEMLCLFDTTWHFIPCLNLDDQPDGGRSLSTVMRDPNIREVEWCVSNPRSETQALLDYVNTISPIFTFPLHDEYHSGETIPLTVLVSECLDFDVCERIRTCVRYFGLLLEQKNPHETMGTTFRVASEFAGTEYSNATWSLIETHGLVTACEVSQQEGISAHTLVATQISIGLTLLNAVLYTRTKNTEQDGCTGSRASSRPVN